MAGPAVAGGAVATRGGRILEVGPADDLARRHPDAQARDLGEALLLPGLVDAHCHLEWSLLEGLLPPQGFAAWLSALLPLRGRLGPADHRAAARLGALRALRAGTTTLADSGPAGAGAAAATQAGLRAGVHLEAFGDPTGPRAAEAAEALAERVAALDREAGPRVRVGVSPHAPYSAGPGLWSALSSHPGLAGRPVATHLAESPGEARAIAAGEGPLAQALAGAGLRAARWDGPAGAGPVERLAAAGALAPGLVAAHCVQLAGGDPERLAAAGVGVAHCPRSNAHLRCGRMPLAELRAAGVPVGLGTDSPASGGDYDPRAEARACAAAHRDEAPLDPVTLLRLITLDAARVLRMADVVGSLEAGKRADLLALRPPPGAAGEPHELALRPEARVELVAVEGEVLLESGRLSRVDPSEVETAAAGARERLC
jgi:cytosine/adenosine deaminase-related metal-dependent hydrolase